MSSSYNIELGFISKLLQTKDITTVKDSQIKVSYFSGDNKTAYQFIYDTLMTTGEVPTIRAFSAKFPNYALETCKDKEGNKVVGTEENLKYWCEELRKKKKHNSLAESVVKVADMLQDFDTEDAFSEIKKTIAFIENEVEESLDIDLTKNTENRIQAYLDRKKNKGMRGLPTGFKKLDYMLKGLEKSTLTTMIGTTGVGKSWFEIAVGSYCQLQNCRVLQLVTEMSEEIMRDRYETMLFSKCYGSINYNAFKSGTLDMKTEENYFRFLKEDLPKLEPLIIATATGVMGISALIDKYKPDIVLIDSAYLMDDDEGSDSDWLRITHITRDLKKLAKRAKIPILINSQADKNTSKKTGPELGSISYSQSIGMDSDNVLAIYRDEVMLNDKEMGIKILKQREGTLGKVVLNWNFDEMDFSDIYSESAEEDSKEIKDNTLGVDVL